MTSPSASPAGDTTICDERVSVRNEILSTGRARLPQVEKSALMSPHNLLNRGCRGASPRTRLQPPDAIRPPARLLREAQERANEFASRPSPLHPGGYPAERYSTAGP